MASGMGGMRTAGDLVARVQLNRGLKLEAAKAYVAGRLNVSANDLSDPIAMAEIREDLKLGCISQVVGVPKGIEAKIHIDEVLGIGINSVVRFKERTGLVRPPKASETDG